MSAADGVTHSVYNIDTSEQDKKAFTEAMKKDVEAATTEDFMELPVARLDVMYRLPEEENINHMVPDENYSSYTYGSWSVYVYPSFKNTLEILKKTGYPLSIDELDITGIKIHYYDLQKKLKGFFYYQSRQKNIVIDHNVNGILERILVAHELGHAVLHTKIAMMHGFQEMEVFDDRSIEENEANFFAAELLLEDGKVLECLSEHTFFETAKMLYVPAALLDYKFSLLHEKGELVNSMYIRKADFLKEDLHAYDNDIGYGDI